MTHLRQIAELHGFVLRRQAIEIGYADRDLYRMLHDRTLVRIRHGAYAFTDMWRQLAPEGRHLAIAHATQDLTPGPTALSHATGMVHLGCPLYGVPLDTVHLTRLDRGSSRREAGTTHHDGGLVDDEVFMHNGRLVTAPARTTVDALSLMSTESAMVSGDWMLAQQLVTQQELWDVKEAMVRWPNTLKLEVSLRLLDGRSGSVGESRERYLIWTMGLPAPELQYEVHDSLGVLVAVTDFAWPGKRAFGEFDGATKYGRHLNPGQDLEEVLFAEKRREDAVRRITGGTMVRHTWVDLRPTSAPSRQLEDLLRVRAS